MHEHLLDDIHLHWKLIFHRLKHFSKTILAELGLTKVDANVLLALSGQKPKTKAELADSLSFEPNSLTRSLDRLLALKLIQRVVHPHDRRFIQLSLTAKGETQAQRYKMKMRAFWREALANIAEPDSEHLKTLLITMVTTLSERKSADGF